MNLKLEQIGCDPNFYPRVNGDADWLTVHRYTDALKANARFNFPAVVVVRATGFPKGFDCPYLLLDGRHRCRAYVAAGREVIPVIVETLPRSKWFARSVELNAAHGRTLDTGDKAWIAERLNEDGWSDEDVGKLLFMSADSIQKIKAGRVVKLTAAARKIIPEGRGNRTMKSGGVGFLKAPLVGANGRMSIVALQSQSRVSSHDVESVLESMIAVLRSGVVEMANPDIAVKVSMIRELMEKL